MSELLVIGYEDEFEAERQRNDLLRLRREDLVDIEDAVVVVRRADGAVRLHQIHDLTAAGALSGGFLGAVVGALVLSPFLGLVVGAATGAVGGALSDVGIDDRFMKDLGHSLTPGSSALFILVRESEPDAVIESLEGRGGRLIRTSLSHRDRDRLVAALNDATAGSVVA